MSISARLYQHANFVGRSAYANLPLETPVNTYSQIPKSWLDVFNLHDQISSVRLSATESESGGRLILFQHGGYRGRFVSFWANAANPVSQASLSTFDFNDRTSSALLVRQFKRELPPIAIGSLGSPSLRERAGELADSHPKLGLRGEPVFTWDLWPSFSPGSKYVYIRIPVEVKINNWFNYDAELRFWIYMYINSSGRLAGYVAWYGAWVEGGILTDSILDELMSGLPDQVGDIDEMIASAVESVNILTFVRLYYLPGRATGGLEGHVDDDVSLVLVKEV